MSEQQAVNTITKIQNMANKYKEAKQMINRFIGVGRLTKIQNSEQRQMVSV